MADDFVEETAGTDVESAIFLELLCDKRVDVALKSGIIHILKHLSKSHEERLRYERERERETRQATEDRETQQATEERGTY